MCLLGRCAASNKEDAFKLWPEADITQMGEKSVKRFGSSLPQTAHRFPTQPEITAASYFSEKGDAMGHWPSL